MATKEDLEARAAKCRSAADFATLAKEAAGLDADYAKALLEKAEMQCQMPPDYIAAAEGAMALGLSDYAGDLYSQAEDACFEAMEFAALGASLARTGADKDKGRALLEKAAGEATKPNEFVTLSGYAQEALGDEALATRLLARVEEKAKTLGDYLNLAKTLKAAGAGAAARSLYAKAARHCDDTDATVAYAKGMLDIFGEPNAARKILEDAETDCQFPKDFSALAAGFKALFDDGDKVSELMEQAAEFAMSGEENLDLAKGYWSLLGDKGKAVAALGKALPEINDKARLLELAGYAASQVGAPALAKRFYAKAEEKMASAAERIKLAEAVIKDTGDKGYALEVYGRAADSLTQPNDLLSVAANVVDQLGDKGRATVIYRKGFAAMRDLGQHTRLLEAVAAKLGDQDFAREILASAGKLAANAPEHLDLAKRTLSVLADKELARCSLEKAEEQITSVGEMKNVVAAVKQYFADDPDWVALAEEKLARREANQAKYALFQEREKAATSSIRLLQLADAVMAELQDKFYARKLLADAQKKMEQEGWDFPKARKLVQGVCAHLGDTPWAIRLLQDAAGRVQGFANLTAVAESAAELLPDKAAAKGLVKDMLAGWEQQIDAAASKTAYDFSKLAGVTGRLLGDREAAAVALEKAAAQGGNHYAFAELARVARDLGDEDKMQAMLERAAECCGSAAQAGQLASRLLATGFPREQVRTLYRGLKQRLATPGDKLGWVDGIIDLFGDRAWAKQEYAALEQGIQGKELAAVQYRRRQRIGHKG